VIDFVLQRPESRTVEEEFGENKPGSSSAAGDYSVDNEGRTHRRQSPEGRCVSSSIVQLYRRVFGDGGLTDCPDEALLRRFVGERDNRPRDCSRRGAGDQRPRSEAAVADERGAGDQAEAAFEAILRRHGPMVLDVCRGLLPNESDAEDAFQATFLILARKAASIRKTRSLASWLHGVAYRVARRAQTEFARRRKHEPRATERPTPQTADDLTWAEVRQALHEELNTLPDRLRGPLVLCYLEGMGQDQAAAELGLPKGTLKGRLERARELLRARLVRRGLGPAAALLASAWPVTSVSAALADSALRAATGAAGPVSATASVLAGEVLRTMSLAKFRTAAFLAVAAALCAGIGAYALHASTDAPAEERHTSNSVERAVARPVAPQPKLEWQEGPATIPKQAGPVHALAFDPNGKMLAVASTSTGLKGEVRGEIKVYDITSGKELTVLSGFAPVAFSPDGKSLAAREGDNVVRVWEVGKWVPQIALKGLPDTVLCAAISPDGKFLVAGSGNPSKPNNPGMVRLWDLENGLERATHTHPGAVYGVAFAADGKTFLSASSGIETVIKSWDGRAGQEPAETKGSGRRFLSVAFSPDGKTVATGIDPVGDTSEMDVTVWDRATGKELFKRLWHPEYVQAMAFTPDGKILATGSSALVGVTERVGVARLWDVETGKELADLRGHKGEIRCLTFGPKRRTLVTGSWDGTVKLWVLAEPVGENDDLWVKSEDGVLALRVSAFVKTAAPGEPIELVARLRNLSDKPVNVLRPFGDDYAAGAAGVAIHGPGGKLGYQGDPRDYTIGADAFVRLKPGESVRDSLKLNARDYAGFDKPGRYTITFTYSYKGNWDKVAEQGGLTRVWRGAIAGKSIPIEIPVNAAEPVKAVFDPDDERVKAFVAHLERSGVKLAHEKSNKRGRWRVVEPKIAGGTVFVGLCSFTGPASEEQMREALSDFSWGWQYKNVPGRLSMSLGSPLTEGFEKGTPDEVSALYEKLRVLFFWYQRDKLPADPLTNATLNADRRNKDERVQALVDYFGRNGIKLTYSETTLDWRIVEPKHEDGEFVVYIRALPVPATEEQMRWALSQIALPFQLNVRAHLAISQVLHRGGSGKVQPAAVKELAGKLLRLFHDYSPASFAAHIKAGELPDEGVKEAHGLWDYCKSKGIELRYIENSTNTIQYLFSVGPDHDKRLCIGFGYIPPAKAEKLKEKYRDYPIPHVVRGNLVLFKVGAPNGTDTKEFAAVWDKVETAFREYPGPAKDK
jgi:RNA polymerase sigma factor (sigma-70 family)